MFFIWIIALYTLGNSYVFYRATQALASYSTGVKVLLSILYWLCALSLFIAFALRKSSIHQGGLTLIYEVGSSWLVFTLYMVIGLLLFDIIKLIYKPVPFSFLITCALTLCTLSYGYYSYLNPKIQRFDLQIDKEAKDSSLKIVGLSDMHLGIGTGKEMLKKYVELINAQKPDLILISGDLIDNEVKPLYANRMEEELSLFKATYGVYMVPGNHEYIGGINECINFIKQTPIHFLKDSMIELPNGVQIVGRDDKHNSNRSSLEDLMKKVDISKPVILLDHQPFGLDNTANAGIDLQLSGHTHSGQIWPMNLIVKNMFERSYGYEKRKDSHIYISSGISLWGPPFRIGTNSEIVVFDIKFR